MCTFMTSPDHSLKLKRTERLLLPHCETFSSRYVIHTGARMLSDVFQSHPTPPSMLSLLGEWVHTGQKQSCNLKSHKYWLSITDLIPLYHADILHTATMFNPILLNRLEAIRSERITAAALCETEMRLNHILCWSDTRLEWAEGSRRGQPFSEAETCKCTDSRDKSTNTEKTIMERWKKKGAEWKRMGIRWMARVVCYLQLRKMLHIWSRWLGELRGTELIFQLYKHVITMNGCNKMTVANLMNRSNVP